MGSRCAYWVEGIGSSKEFFMTVSIVPTHLHFPSAVMLACYENGECIFTQEDFDSLPTAVDNVTKTTQENTPTYDVNGRRMIQPYKGKAYIKDGRKYLCY